MTTRSHAAGSVVWLDLSTTDVDRARRYYGELLGWEYEASDTGQGVYVIARVPGGEVGGMMAQDPAQTETGVPSAWTVFFGTDDIDHAVARVEELGGSVLEPPFAIPGDVRIAIVADPTGAVCGLMETSDPGVVWGAGGSPCWVECLTREPETSRRFHESLFGWKSGEGTGDYVVFSTDGSQVAGLMAMPPQVPEEAPSYWLVYFAVDDVDEMCGRTEREGGTVLEPTHGIDEGRFAVLEDPTGAVFAVFEGGIGTVA